MATTMTTTMDKTEHVLFLGKFENNKKYKEKILQEIKSAICAMLNTNGGKVMIHIDTDSSVPVEGTAFSQTPLVIRILDQSIISIIGSQQTVSKVNFSRRNGDKDDEESIVVSVQKADSLVTMNHNLFLPSETQVVQVSSIEIPNAIINRKIIEDPNQLGSHWKIFVKGEICGLKMESKICQFKNLKAEQSKRITLADRITGKGNKFSCCVSAFANHSGGHIYYGITDGGVVEGEFIPDKEKREITKKVRKIINKMIWPDQIGEPKRREQWEIFFEPVVDANSQPVASTFVIVLYISSCLGGVFTEEPECYEMMEGQVSKMSVAAWRKRILGPNQIESIPREIAPSLAWNSKTTEKLCIQVFCDLTLCMNNGDLEGFEKAKEQFTIKHPHIVELQLVVLLKEILACSRKHDFEKANSLLQEYNTQLANTSERCIFDVLELYIKAAYNRAKGDEGSTLNLVRDLLVSAVAMSQWLMPGLVTALVNLFAATMADSFDNTSLRPPIELANKALQHLKQVKLGNSDVHADFQHRAHIILAAFNLGCNLSGNSIAHRVDDKCVDEAYSSIRAIEKFAKDNSKLTHYRAVQLKLVQSIYNFRCSQNQPKEREHFMWEALKSCKDAGDLAKEWNFHEMVSWSKSLKSLLLLQQHL